MKKRFLSSIALAGAAALALTACAGSDTKQTVDASTGGGSDAGAATDLIKVGFAQTGAESGWRAANTESFKAAFTKENGFELVFNAADNDPAAQIAAVRSFINQGVDAIVMAPIVEDGWDDVLNEAKDAGIPVFLEDRTVTADESLYVSWVGLDFTAQGTYAGEWAVAEFEGMPTKLVVLEGTTGSAAANERAAGFIEAIDGSSLELIDSQTGDFTRDGGRTVMEGFIAKYGVDGIDLVYAHNDDMGLGAIEAIEAAGAVPGVDIKIVTIDAVKDGMQALVDGKFNYIVEHSPLLGDVVAGIVKDQLAGKEIEKEIYLEIGQFDQAKAKEVIDSRKY